MTRFKISWRRESSKLSHQMRLQTSSTTFHHYAVLRRDKSTTKVRVVYAASARGATGPSLNDCLFKGPLSLINSSYKIALTADLEKAFLMVSVEEADRDVLRFIWVEKDPPDLRVYRLCSVSPPAHSSLMPPYCSPPALFHIR